MAGNGRGWLAVVCMLGSVLAYSIVPLVISVSGGVESPFLFNAGWRLGLALGCLLALAFFYRNVLLDKGVLSIVAGSAISWTMLFATFQVFENALFAWSVRYLDISAANILFETWPIIFVFLTAWLLGAGSGYRRNLLSLFPMLLLALAGFAFVILGETGGFSLDSAGAGTGRGVVLALLAALAASFGAFHLRWGRDVALRISQLGSHGASGVSLVFMGAVLSYAISNVLGVVLNAGIGLSLGETFGGTLDFSVVLVGVFGGFALHSVGGMLFRLSNLVTDNLGVNALNYSIPVLSLFWLWGFSEVRILRPDFLLIGASAIVAANLIINFESEIRWGFKALLLSLGISGAVVYLRDSVFEFAGVEKWHWTAGGYFEGLALSATVFTLLLAFRVSRLVSRAGDEDTRTFNLFRKLDLDALARSKQQDITTGEMFALGIFAGITIFLALLSRPPEADGWSRLLADVFAMLISGVIAFLTVNVWDLRREREESKLEIRPGREDYTVRFAGLRRRSFDQWIAIVVGGAIVLLYAGLMAYKWMGWFSWLG